MNVQELDSRIMIQPISQIVHHCLAALTPYNPRDLINLMAYDFTGSWSQKAGHHAQLFGRSAEEGHGNAAINYVLSTGFPAAKILLGVPVYGRSFLNARGPGHPYDGCGGDEGTFEYKDLPRPGTEEIIDTTAIGAFCVGGDGGWVSYDNPQTVQMKASYCKQKRLGVSQPCS
jgi:chitinase